MNKVREYALIGTIAILGVVLAIIYAQTYAQAFDNRATITLNTITLSDAEPNSVEDRQALEQEAIKIALADPRVKQLVEEKNSTITAVFKMNFRVMFVDNKTETFYVQWDGKYRADVTIRYADDTGYILDVNITDKVVGEPIRGVWEEGKYFKPLSHN